MVFGDGFGRNSGLSGWGQFPNPLCRLLYSTRGDKSLLRPEGVAVGHTGNAGNLEGVRVAHTRYASNLEGVAVGHTGDVANPRTAGTGAE